MRLALTSLLVLTFGAVAPQVAWSQVTRASNEQPLQRGQFVDGILRTLTRSSAQFNAQQPLTPIPNERITPEMQRARQSLQAFANEAGQLITALRYEEKYSSFVRTLLGDALQVKATADVLVTRSGGMSSVSQLATEFAELDRQWHLLSHQLRQTVNLSNTVMQRVDRLDQANKELENQLKLTPQMDQGGLAYFYAALGEYLGHLAEDVRVDLYSHPNRDQYIQSLLRLQTKAQQLRLAVENNYPYQDVTRYYKQFHSEWLSVKGELRAVQNRYVQRSLTRVTQINDRIHELLWLPPVIDGRDILYQAEQLQTQVNQAAEQVSLQELMQQPNASQIFGACQEFYGLCGDFRESVATSTQLDSLRWDFRVLDVSWSELKQQFNPFSKPETIQNVAAIEASVSELRRSLGLQSTVDLGQAVELASVLNNMSELLYYDINRYVGRSNQYSSQFRNQAVQMSDQFHKTAEALHESLLRRGENQEIQRLSKQMAQQWNELQQLMAQIPFDQRNELAITSREIAPAMAKLQVMYSF